MEQVKRETNQKRGRRHSYSSEEIRFLKSEMKNRSYAELTILFNERFGLAFDPDQTGQKIRKLLPYGPRRNHKYTPEEKRFIENNISGYTYAELTHMFNRKFNCSITVAQIKGILYFNNLRNGQDFRSRSGSYNHTARPIGSEYVCPQGYTRVKIAEPGVWKMKHHIIWEAVNGPIPKGHRIMFADGNKRNFDLDNLLLVSRAELGLMNKHGLIFPDRELTKTGKAIADIKLLMAKKREARKKA